eukprot:g3511.t1
MNVVLEIEETRNGTITTPRRPSSTHDDKFSMGPQTPEKAKDHAKGREDTHAREVWINRQYSLETTRMGPSSHLRRPTRPQRTQDATKTINNGGSPSTIPCQFYLRTGTCGYGENCRYLHPPNIAPPKLNEIGYPTRKGVEKCRFYIKNGFCGFGATCRYDHPNPIRYRNETAVFPQSFGTSYLSVDSDVDLGSPPHADSGCEIMVGGPFPTHGWYPQVPALSMNYSILMSQQSGYPYGIRFSHYPYEYPALPQDWPRNHRPSVNSGQMERRTPENSEETTEVYEDVTKYLNEEEEEDEEDSDSSAYVSSDHCLSSFE